MTPNWVELCGAVGPYDGNPDSQLCQYLKGHLDLDARGDLRFHKSENDDGTVTVIWEDDWVHGNGRWRTE